MAAHHLGRNVAHEFRRIIRHDGIQCAHACRLSRHIDFKEMIEGRIGKFYKEICLLEQPFVKDTEKTVEQVLNEVVAKIGEKIVVRRFVRYQLGEGLEKRTEDFAAEVAKATGAN